jgi:hypothetical protein
MSTVSFSLYVHAYDWRPFISKYISFIRH